MPEARVGQWPGIENRKHKRVPLGVSIECRSGQMNLKGIADNISIQGLLVRISKTFQEGEEIAVSFALPGSTQPIQSRARVAHVVPDVFMGLELLDLSNDSREEIEKYIAAADLPTGKPR